MSTPKTLAAGDKLVDTMDRVEKRFKSFYSIAAITGLGSVVGTAETENDIVEALECFERGVRGVEVALTKAAVEAKDVFEAQNSKRQQQQQAAGGAQ